MSIAREAHDRLEYFLEIKTWVDGYINAMDKALAENAPIDRDRYAAALDLRTRCTEIIFRDAMAVAELDVNGKKVWNAPLNTK